MRQRTCWERVCRTLALTAFLAAVATAQNGTDELASRVDELFAPWNRSDAPGAAVAVIRDGHVVYANAFGMADLERGVALTPLSAFEIGSISKQFTALCILLLEHDGALSVDDDVRKYVPEMPVYERPITLRQLLHHTSGVRDVETLVPLAGMPYVNYYSEAGLLELVARQKGLNFPPGSQHLYSNSGYLLLAIVVERVSGSSLREFAQQRIFGPLGMRHTSFWDNPAQIVPNRAIAYTPNGKGGYGMEMWNMPFAGPAGLYTTVGDLALWDANFYDNKLGGGAALIEKMTTPGTLDSGEVLDYAAGLVVTTYRDMPLITHGGAWMGYRASLMRLPEQRLTVIVLANTSTVSVSGRAIADLYLGETTSAAAEPPTPFEPPGTIEVAPEQLEQYTGTYWNETDRLLRRIEVRGAELHYVRGEDNATRLGAVEAGRFVMIGPAVRVDVAFETGTPERGRTMTVHVEGEEPLLFEPVTSPSNAVLAACVGDYWSEELGRGLRLRLEDGQIQMMWAGDERPSPAAFIDSDRLLVQQFVPVPWAPQDVEIEVERDGSDRVTGLRLSCEMVRGITFVRKPRD